MPDNTKRFLLFLKTITDKETGIVWEKDEKYEVVNEDEGENIYCLPEQNGCACAISKADEGRVFNVVYEQQGEKIILYTTDNMNTCSRCKSAKMQLDKLNLPYEIINSTDEIIKLGFSETPILSVNGKLFSAGETATWIHERQLEEINGK